MDKIITLLVMAILPVVILTAIKKYPVLHNLGAIAICYICGFIISMLPFTYDKGFTQTVASVIVAIAIPLILFGFDIRCFASLAKSMIVGYCLQIFSAVVSAAGIAIIASRHGFMHAAQLAGMTTGLYTGGTPNMIAVGSALIPASESAEVITAANTADFFVGGVYFLLIISVLRPVYRRFLGESKDIASIKETEGISISGEYDYAAIPKDRRSIARLAGVILLAVVCLAIGAGLEFLINGSLDGSLFIMITVSVLGIAFSFIKPVRETEGSYQIGQYLVLVFSLGLSMSIDLAVLARSLSQILIYYVFVKSTCFTMHLLLCKLFRLDGGTAIITNTAGIYGPPFIAPVAEAYGERELIVPGIVCAVTGLVIGNLLGISVGELLSLIPGM